MTIDTSSIFMDILDFDPNRKRINHLLKVMAYAEIIGAREGMPEEEVSRLRLAAMLHDIGIKASRIKFNSSAAEHQQREGPAAARELLAKYACPPEIVERVCHLIAHHHDYDNIDGLDYQILVEADFLVNCDEGGMDQERIRAIRRDIFRTGAGIALLEALFAL